MTEKDFLAQFSSENKKPESFKEEERILIKKQKKPFNFGLLIGIVLSLVLVAGICYFIFLAPKIVMPDFVGKTKEDVTKWVKQYEIETSGIVFNEAYYFDYDEGVIVEQSINTDTKVKNNVKLTFEISKGADPKELIELPDIQNMDKEEISKWIDDNKLSKTKITLAYSDTVEKDKVISFTLSGEEEDFTRETSLKIVISKGEEPQGLVKLEDFKDKTFDYVQSWAKTKNVVVNKKELYSDEVEAGLIISQDIVSGKSINEGESFTVTVSKGKAIKMINLCALDYSEAVKWLNENGLDYKEVKKYSKFKEGTIISDDPEVGTIVNEKEITLTISLGDRVSLNIGNGDNETDLIELINELNANGCSLTRVKNETSVYSYNYKKNQISSIIVVDENGVSYDLNEAPLNGKLVYNVSLGKIYSVESSFLLNESDEYLLIKVCDYLAAEGLNYEIVDERSDKQIDSKTVCKITLNDIEVGTDNFDIYEDQSIKLIIE